ncbi:PilW family protein [Psychrobacter pacificensis]|uniref:PilW family protein n=1 Tax=Psychrobacter pacificensis TaxID=112002 RepID=UPI003D019022
MNAKIYQPILSHTVSLPYKSLPISKKHEGFTLVELMIALVLGLLISAAALQVFYTSSVNSRRQAASSQIQDNAIFGFSQMQKNLRRTNYGAKSTDAYDEFFMNHLTPQGGVVLTAPEAPEDTSDNWLNGNLSGLVLDGKAIPANLLSSNGSATSSSSVSVENSDQLTIQYQSGIDGLFDCEGAAIPEGFYVIERYFVRLDETVTPNTLGLACASAIYNYDEDIAGSSTGLDIASYVDSEGDTKDNNLSGDGTIIIPNVDYFRVLIGISDSIGFATYPDKANIAYMPIPAPSSLDSDQRIVSLQIGILSRSDNPTATQQSNSELSFDILDIADATLNTGTIAGPTYLRSVYESTILLRNARGGL